MSQFYVNCIMSIEQTSVAVKIEKCTMLWQNDPQPQNVETADQLLIFVRFSENQPTPLPALLEWPSWRWRIPNASAAFHSQIGLAFLCHR